MTWWKASSVTVTAGQSTVTVNTGDDIGMIKGAEGLVIGSQPPVEIKRSYLNASVMMLELMAPWPYATQSGQPAIAFPTDGDLAAATAVLKQLINGLQMATELQMQQATDNSNLASALRVKQSIDYHTFNNYKKTNILGSVSIYGGVPTGALIETGSNANGYYSKDAGGNVDIIMTPEIDTTLDASTIQTFTLPVVIATGIIHYSLTPKIQSATGSVNQAWAAAINSCMVAIQSGNTVGIVVTVPSHFTSNACTLLIKAKWI